MQAIFDKLTPSDLGILQVTLDDCRQISDDATVRVLMDVIYDNQMANDLEYEDFAYHIVHGLNRRLTDGL